MSKPSTPPIVRAAFMPLLDAAPLIAAAHLGLAREEGLDLRLERETSWATLRDRVAVGHLDVAHMLAPMPIASNLGLAPLPARLVVPIALGYGGNTITVSQSLWRELFPQSDATAAMPDAMTAGRLLAHHVRHRSLARRPKLTVAVVHTHSAHYYQLAYWLAAVGIDPERDIDLVVVPPSLTAAALAEGQIDAFCAGEPWGSVAVAQSLGRVLATNTSIWQSSPEKVLAIRERWLDDDVARAHALVRSIHRAAFWCDDVANSAELVRLLARADAINLDEATISKSLEGRAAHRNLEAGATSGFLTFARNGASFPWLSHASWFYAQMVRWRQVPYSAEGLQTARSTYRPDLFRAALKTLGVDMPAANSKVEGQLATATPVGSTRGRLILGPDAFCDGRIFDPDDVERYVASLPPVR